MGTLILLTQPVLLSSSLSFPLSAGRTWVGLGLADVGPVGLAKASQRENKHSTAKIDASCQFVLNCTDKCKPLSHLYEYLYFGKDNPIEKLYTYRPYLGL